MEQQTAKINRKVKKQSKKDLMQLERPAFKVQRSEEGKVQGIIQKLMQQKKQKPAIGFMPRSHLIDQLDSFLPVLKQSNQLLSATELRPEQKLDAKLQEVQSSSSQSQDEDAMVDEKQQKMQRQKPEPTVISSCDQFQFNIMTYPYPQKKQGKEEPTDKLAQKFDKVVEIKELNHQMQELD